MEFSGSGDTPDYILTTPSHIAPLRTRSVSKVGSDRYLDSARGLSLKLSHVRNSTRQQGAISVDHVRMGSHDTDFTAPPPTFH